MLDVCTWICVRSVGETPKYAASKVGKRRKRKRVCCFNFAVDPLITEYYTELTNFLHQISSNTPNNINIFHVLVSLLPSATRLISQMVYENDTRANKIS